MREKIFFSVIKSGQTVDIPIFIERGKLSSLDSNYCSKFLWQAFYYGSGINLTNLILDGNSSLLITPSHVKNSNNVY